MLPENPYLFLVPFCNHLVLIVFSLFYLIQSAQVIPANLYSNEHNREIATGRDDAFTVSGDQVGTGPVQHVGFETESHQRELVKGHYQ